MRPAVREKVEWMQREEQAILQKRAAYLSVLEDQHKDDPEISGDVTEKNALQAKQRDLQNQLRETQEVLRTIAARLVKYLEQFLPEELKF